MKHIRISKNNDNITILTFDVANSEMNILSREVLEEFNDALTDINSDRNTNGLVIISGKNDNFIAGANIEEIATFKTAEDAANGSAEMQKIFQKLADLKVTTVCAIHGACLGGGLELALACDWRVATADSKTKLSLPEIQLGIIPGAGGTQRLPRLIGIEESLGMILTGKRLSGKKAIKIKLIDACVPNSQLLEQAIQFTSKEKRNKKQSSSLFNSNIGKELPKWAIEGNPLGRKVMYKKAKEQIDSKTKGFYPASYKALDAVFDGIDKSLSAGLKIESTFFGELAVSKECKSLIHLFNATTAIKKHPYKDAHKERFGDEPCTLIGVVGAGLMGAGISAVASDRGIQVRISDPNKDAIGRAIQYADIELQNKLRRRRIKSFERTKKLAHISPGLKPIGFGKCDVVIEAVFEDLKLKSKILQDLENQQIHDNWFFASNTSAIPINEIAKASKYPERVCGMHFFSPVEKMPLLEVVVGDKTADWVAGRAVKIGQDLGKQVIIVKDGPGFYTTRALAFFLAEAAEILAEGGAIKAVDSALTDFGYPVGPITLIDEVGIDVGLHVLETISKAFPSRLKSSSGLVEIANSGRLGKKNRKGFYLYEDGKKTDPDPEIAKFFKVQKDHEKISKDDIKERCLMVFINESVRCLEEGILNRPYDGDIGAVFGLGFPPFLGGPFKYVDDVGCKKVVEILEKLSQKHGDRFTPCSKLKEMASSGEKFYPEGK